MIYGYMLSNESKNSSKNSKTEENFDIYLFTKADLRQVIRFLDEHYIPIGDEGALSPEEKEKLDKQRKKEKDELKKQNNNSNNEKSVGAFHINLELTTKNTIFKIHIRNSLGASQDLLSGAEHGPSVKFIRKGLTDNRGVPILIDTGEVLTKNVDNRIVDEINRKYHIAIEFVVENKAPLKRIWFTDNPRDIELSLNRIIANISNNKKYISYNLNFK